MSVLDNFGQWKQFLGNRLQHAENQGMSDRKIAEIAEEIGGYLAEHVDPKNEEERLLQDLWQVGNEQERHAIANMMVKLVKNQAQNGQQ